METQNLTFKREQSYEILLGTDILSQMVGKVSRMGFHRRCAVLTNETVAKWYLEPLVAELQKRHFQVLPIIIPDGESEKSVQSAFAIYPKLLREELERKSPLIALGGGVIGDLGGFVAATYKRGIPFINFPTTLMAMVDASIGGKVAVNLPEGKNLVGSFYQPSLVGIDLNTLKTLPLTQLSYGLVECVKHGLISDPAYYKFILKNREAIKAKDLSFLQRLIRRSLHIKKSVVEEDELERGRRAILNYGHTFGHALEVLGEYRRFHHGEAVGLGMLMALQVADELEILKEDYHETLTEFLKEFNLPTRIPREYEFEKFLHVLLHDKKRTQDKSKFILPICLGKVEEVCLDQEKVEILLRAVLANLYQ